MAAFIVLKILKPILLPPFWILAGLVVGCFLLSRERYRAARCVLFGTAAVFFLLSIEPVAALLAWGLEQPYVTADAAALRAANPSAIVVLAGGATEAEGYRPFPELSGQSWRRLARAIDVYRSFDGAVPVLYSGGSGDPFQPVSHEAELAREHAARMGIPGDRFSIESESRTTRESGAAIRAWLDARHPGQETHAVVLVTSARHLRRSLAALGRHRIRATPAAADFSGGVLRWNALSIMPSASAFSVSSGSIHEWIGTAVYAMLGRADDP